MTKLERHIEILLLKNDCVIVPGLGGFVAHHIKARYDEQDGMFLPPYRTLGFNAQLTMNDSLLVQSYVDAYDLSYPEALSQIEEEVAELYHTLENEGCVELNGLGKLYTNAERKLQFEPCESGILTPNYYGLSSFELPLLRLKRATDASAIADASANKHKVIYIDATNKKDKRISISVKAFRNSAAAAALLAATLLIAFPISNRKGLPEQQVKSGVLYNIFDSSDTSNASAQVRPVRTATVEAQKSLKKPEENPHYWTIVLASHVTEPNAQAYVEYFQKRGFSETRVYEGVGSIKVLYGFYASQHEAYAKLKSMNTTPGFKKAWVLEIGQ